MAINNQASTKALQQACGFFIAVSALILAIILWANNGALTFVLDDPFIYLAMAENIIQGHYGVNLSEPSSPASSILWPFILAPSTLLPFAEYAMLFLNVGLALAVIHQFNQFITGVQNDTYCFSQKQQRVLLIFFIFMANLFGLVFIAMEHTLQIWLTLLAACGLLQVCQGEQPNKSLWWALLLAPLVRYENLAISMPALLFLFLNGYAKRSVMIGFSVMALLTLFSLFLHRQGLPYLPTSVLLKSGIEDSLLTNIFEHLKAHYRTPKAAAMLILMLAFLHTALSHKVAKSKRQLAGISVLAIVLFIFCGSYGWYFRYEIFIWVFVWLMALYFYRSMVVHWIDGLSRKALASWFAVLSVILCLEHGFATLASPVAANNIYMQQYQMSRFIDDYYHKPVAVNDLGLVAYKNKHYVLDLWGLASSEALNARKLNTQQQQLGETVDVQWMNVLAQRYDVELAMMYYSTDSTKANGWFEKVPNDWIKLGELKMYALSISVSKREVAFFAMSETAKAELLPLLKDFSETLPELTEFVFAE